LQFARGSSAVEELLRGAVVGLGRLEEEWLGKDGASNAGKDWMKVFKDVGARFGGESSQLETSFTSRLNALFSNFLILSSRRRSFRGLYQASHHWSSSRRRN